MKRCAWVPPNDPLYAKYHDIEWGVPIHDDQKLFEMLCLEGAQAGLSWENILKKRQGYRDAFENFDPEKIVGFDVNKINHLMQNPNIVRNRLKIQSVIVNAHCFLEVRKSFGSFNRYIWQFVDGRPIINQWDSHTKVPAKTAESEKMSKVLKKQGFKFVGATICYAFMQAVGMVNDHLVDCFRYSEINRMIPDSQDW
jgi:DNA-3-methyladenine glycosylase I